MRPIPPKMRQAMAEDPYYKQCARVGIGDHVCSGRITWEHALIYAGKQVNEIWAIIPLCEKAHAVGLFQDSGDFDKEINVWIALNRATEMELQSISKVIDYIAYRNRLNKLYGVYSSKR